MTEREKTGQKGLEVAKMKMSDEDAFRRESTSRWMFLRQD